MTIAIITSSIFILASIAWLTRQLTPIKICPICAGVAGTWLWLFFGMFSGILPQATYQLPTAILIGGSVVGIGYQLEKKIFELSGLSHKSSAIFKALFIPAGFIAAYFLILSQWLAFALMILFLVILTELFIKTSEGETTKKNQKAAEIKKKLEDCC